MLAKAEWFSFCPDCPGTISRSTLLDPEEWSALKMSNSVFVTGGIEGYDYC